MVARPRMTKQDKIWQAQDDVRTLAMAEEIKLDKLRLGFAKKQAKIMAADQEKIAKALKKIGGVKSKKK